MSDAGLLSDIRITPADAHHERTGFLGWATFVLAGALRIDGVAIRRTARGELTLSYPARTDRQGRQHPYVLPVAPELRARVEAEVLSAAHAAGVAA